MDFDDTGFVQAGPEPVVEERFGPDCQLQVTRVADRPVLEDHLQRPEDSIDFLLPVLLNQSLAPGQGERGREPGSRGKGVDDP